MGIYDREYYRREGPGFLQSLTERGKVCKYVILVNVGVFILQTVTQPGLVGGGWFTDSLDLRTWEVLHGEVWRLLTYAFCHAGIMHILFNMLFLWWFGVELEEMYGPWEFLSVYLTAAVVGGLGYMATDLAWHWEVLQESSYPCVGASGAVMAVMVIYACHFPYRQILVFFFLPMRVWFLVLLAVAFDAYAVLSGSGRTGGVAVGCHLAGAAFGFVYYKQQWRLLNLWSWARSQRRPRPRLRVYREEAPPTPVAVTAQAPPQQDVDEHLEAKLDAVLEKVARHGQESLTDSERQILFRASEVYKKRRT
jgi:membrane associated rhomboid family serine protease